MLIPQLRGGGGLAGQGEVWDLSEEQFCRRLFACPVGTTGSISPHTLLCSQDRDLEWVLIDQADEKRTLVSRTRTAQCHHAGHINHLS